METEMSASGYSPTAQTNSFDRANLNDLKAAAIPVQAQTARRVLFIAHQFAPSLEMGARSCVQIARYLPQHDWSPVVLTVQERYIEESYRGRADEIARLGLPDGVVRTRMLPHPFDLYRWLNSLRKRRRPDGDDAAVAASQTPLRESDEGKGTLRQLLLSVLSMPDMYTGWLLPAVFAGWKAARQRGVQQIFSSGPFWTNHLVGYALSHLTGLPWTAHFRDPWIAGTWETPTSAIADKLSRRLERLIVTRASAVVGVTEEHAEAFRRTYPHLPANKFFAVPNGFDNAEWEELPPLNSEDAPREESGLGKFPGKFLIAYTGTFYVERDPRPLFRALQTLIESGELKREQVQVDLIGWCDTSEGRSVGEMAAAHGLGDCVHLLGPRSRPETLCRMRQADLLLLLAERFVIQIPGKTYEYLRSGRPILALTSEGALANLLRRIGGGWVVNPTDEAGLTAALRERVSEWKEGRNSRAADPALVAAFDRQVLAGRLTKVFEHLRS